MTEEEQIRAQIEAEMRVEAKRQADKRLRQEAKELIHAADAGDLDSQVKVAEKYEEGSRYFPQDLTKAFHYTQMAAEQGSADAQNKLAYLYINGRGMETNIKECFRWFLRSAESGHIDSMLMVGGFCYRFGYGVTGDIFKSMEWLTKAQQHGCKDEWLHESIESIEHLCLLLKQEYIGALSSLNLATQHTNGARFFGKDLYLGYHIESRLDNQSATLSDKEKIDSTIDSAYEEKAVAELKAWAHLGHAVAQNNLGRCYSFGHGVAQDYKKAVEWFTKSAEQGDASAQYNLGFCYGEGHGVAQDYKKAVEWYTKSAEQGPAVAQNNLGICYDKGLGVAQDYKKAVEWYTKSAEQGEANAQCNLAHCYGNGKGVDQSKEMAFKWYTKAAEGGNLCAIENLGGWCYLYGNGTAVDVKKALYWLQKAIDMGANDDWTLERYKKAKEKNGK